ncbi:hypothetical protein [Granulosicoccus antarcticus]|uniref:Uncharacterized protein n=1 Tax=Granulosicoccus antarcticus IMCC3135 TaxID=1192854 RepID=A0A2Z2NIP3_9GAMM|nr:hypothetical protein [Granulosicoccus antarcticus]ASJ70355.1 hypothetical protein IMCC3135_01180 [Granulosicoccus antarcticus IMCC3135]
MKIIRILSLTTACLVSGCAANSEVKEIEIDLVALTKIQLQELLVNHTFPFSKGGMFFESDTVATVHWDGENEDTIWYATEDSTFCYTAEVFGGAEECLGLKKTASGDYLREFEGKTIPVKASDIKEGKTF